MTNFAKFGSDEPPEGSSTAIFACNYAKPLSSMFFDQMPTFLTSGKVIGSKKVFSLHPTVHDLKEHNPKWTPSRTGTILNRHDPEWTPSRMDTIPNGHNPK